MKTHLVRSLVILLTCCSAGSLLAVGTAETNGVPKILEAHIGGPQGPVFSINLREGVLLYSQERGGAAPVRVTPTGQQWRQFRRSLDVINVWHWRTNYPNPSFIRDGTQWSLKIQYADRTLATQGDNNFPGLGGTPSGKPETTEAFAAYRAAITNLVGREFH
jgi:hypothetical protein